MRSVIELHVGEESAWIERAGKEVARRDRSDGGLEATVSELLSDPLAAGERVAVHVHTPPAQTRTLRDLPAVGVRDLNSMVALRQQRFFRPVPGGVETGAEWVTIDGERLARAAAVPADLVRAVEAGAGGGTRLLEMVVTNGTGRLVPVETSSLRESRGRRRARRAVTQLIVALVPWIVVGSVYVVDLQRDDRALAAELDRLDPVLLRLDQIESEVDRFQPVVTALRGQSAPEAWLTPTITRVIQTVGRSSHLHRLEVDDAGRVSIDVHGGDGLDLVTALGEWWDGRIRLVADPRAGDPDAPYTVIMERTDESS